MMTDKRKLFRLQSLRQKFINILDQKTGKEKRILRETIREIEKLIKKAKKPAAGS